MSKPVRLPEYLHQEVERLAQAEKRSTANMVRVLLEQALQLPEHFNLPKEHPGTKEKMGAVQVPADGSMSEPVTASVSPSGPTPSKCGMSNRHHMNSKQNPCPRCGYPA